VAREIFVITIITKVFELAFIHFNPGQFLDLYWSRGSSGIYWFRVRDKGGFSVLRRYNLLCFFISFSSLHLTLRPSHEDMGPNIILEVTDKTLSEKASDMPYVRKARRSKAAIKSSIVPNCFNFVKRPKWLVSVSKSS
jgi:hypothetical protein